MTFSDWIESRWRRPGEAISRALYRLSGDWGISYKTLFYAHRGARVTADTAREIERRTDGAVAAADLVMMPTRQSLRGGRAQPSEPEAA